MSLLRHFAAPVASLLLVLSPQAFGLTAEYGPGDQISHPDTWPQRLVDLAKLPSRVAGHFVNQDDYLAFKGDTAGFQTCLDTCMAISDFAPTAFHIHQGKGTFQGLAQDQKPVPCDWQLDVINQQWRAKGTLPGPKYSLELHVWRDGGVDVTTLKLPSTLKVVKD